MCFLAHFFFFDLYYVTIFFPCTFLHTFLTLKFVIHYALFFFFFTNMTQNVFAATQRCELISASMEKHVEIHLFYTFLTQLTEKCDLWVNVHENHISI